MNEVENSDSQHAELLDHAADLGIDRILTVGDKIGRVAKANSHSNSKEELVEKLKSIDLTNATVLLKASRSIKLESILNSIS